MTRYEAMRYRRAMVHGAQSLPDEEALEAPKLYDRWSATASYVAGERVLYNDVLYKCLADHAAQDDWTPDVAVSLWAQVLIPDPEVIPDWVQPSSTNPYMRGDKVRHNGNVWISDIDYNVFEPGVAGWSIVQ